MVHLSFHQTKSEQMVRAAATVLFNALIKAGHPFVPLAELTNEVQYGFTASALSEPIGPKFVRITDLKDGQIQWDSVPYCECSQPEKYLLHPDDILFARTGATTGKTHLVQQTEYAVFASYLIRVTPNKNRLLPEYLYSFFQSDLYWSQIIEEKQGSAQPNVNGNKLLKIQVPVVDFPIQSAINSFLKVVRSRQYGSIEELPQLPEPLAEQRRIVGRIEELAGKVEEARRLRAAAAGELSALWRSKLAQAYESAVKLAGGTETLETLCHRITDGTHHTPTYVDSGVPFLSVKDITTGQIRFDDCRFITPDEHEQLIKRCNPEYGDVLLTKVGTTGFAKAIDTYREFSMFVSLALLKIDHSRLTPLFTEFMLNSPILKELSAQNTRGVGNQNLVLKFIKQFPMPAPPLHVQEQIVSDLRAFQSKISQVTNLQNSTQKELGALLPSILDKAFKGEL